MNKKRYNFNHTIYAKINMYHAFLGVELKICVESVKKIYVHIRFF